MFLVKRNNGFYYVSYEFPNRKRTTKSTKCKRKVEALKFLANFNNEYLEKYSRGFMPITLKNFCFSYLVRCSTEQTDKTIKTKQTTFNLFFSYLGASEKDLIDIKQSDVKSFLEHRMRTSSVYGARKDLINLSAAFNDAVDNGYLLENPCKGIKRIKVPQKQPLFFAESEYKSLLDVIDDKLFKSLVELALNTAMRQMELITLRWEQVNFRSKLITLDNRSHITKTKKVRSIPLSKRALEVLNELKQIQDSEFVFSKNGLILKQDYVSKKFKRYVRRAKVNDKLHFHSLRHTSASWLIQRGVPIYQVSKILGHSNIKTTEIYSHLRNEDLLNAINSLNN